ncbi:MAG: hydantoinase B/oxoprolinase family protein, partial [Deltaproteobacteria bacterium]|nr:hydantoinase B/oxoprolinase family protein [Deltaproteobacteria bacterium]
MGRRSASNIGKLGDILKMNPITFEVLRNGFRAMCTQGSSMLERVAYGPVITEGHDYSVALLSNDGRLVAHGNRDITPHMGTFEDSVRCTLEDIDEIHPGDTFLMNDPYRGGTHTLDVRLIRPIFYKKKRIAFTVACCHWSDVGGPMPGTFNPKATEVYAEGLVIPPIKIYDRDRPVNPVLQLIKLNVRVPYERMGDLAGQYQAVRLIERRLLEYVDKYGEETILQAFEEIMNYSERVFRREVKQIPDGTYEFVDYSDADEGHPDHPRIKFHCQLIIKGDKVTIDWTKSDPAPRGPAGLTRPGLLSATFDGTLNCFPHLAPLNHGVIRAIKVVTTPGSCVHVLHPTPMAGYCASGYEKVDHAVLCAWGLAFAKLDPKRIFAGTVNLENCCVGGINPKTGRPFVSYTWLEGGQGARADRDGPSFMMPMYAAGATNLSVEVLERWYPFQFLACEGIQDSAGDGKFRGGFGIKKVWRMVGHGINSIHGDREEVTPPGLGGGLNGGPNKLMLNVGTPGEKNLGMFAGGVPLRPGDVISFYSNGGGGYGDPLERDPKLVLEDVIDEFISLEKARDLYGVAIRAIDPEALQYEIDWAKTERLRRELAGRQLPQGFGPW